MLIEIHDHEIHIVLQALEDSKKICNEMSGAVRRSLVTHAILHAIAARIVKNYKPHSSSG